MMDHASRLPSNVTAWLIVLTSQTNITALLQIALAANSLVILVNDHIFDMFDIIHEIEYS